MLNIKQILGGAVCLLISSQAMAELNWFPATKPGFQAEPTVAIIGGNTNFKSDRINDDSVYGVEISVNCPLVQPTGHRIRQQVSLTEVDNGEFEMRSIELNPHHQFEMGSGLEVGFGPGLAYNKIESEDGDDGALALNVGVSAAYRTGNFFVGADVRRQFSGDVEVNGEDLNLDNTRTTLKLGMDFM